MSNVKAVSVRKTEKYPREYKEYLRLEKRWVNKNLKDCDSLLDVGCGDGRMYPVLKKLCNRYVGVDLDIVALKVARKYESSKSKFTFLDVTKKQKKFKRGEFDCVVCLWNTIGNIPNDVAALRFMHHVCSRKCLITVVKKGTLKLRNKYYTTLNANFRIDEKSEIIYSKEWGFSKPYSKNEIASLCKRVGFKVVKIISLGKVGWGIVLAKR